MSEFGEVIYELRKKKGLTVREFARLVELSPGFISQLERDKSCTMPNEANIRKMAYVLNCNEFELLAKAKKIPSEVQEAFFSDPETMLYYCKKIKEKKNEL